MKKFIILMLLFAIALSCIACGAEEAPQETTAAPTEAPTEATVETQPAQTTTNQELTAEQLYGHINQMEPLDGVYMIWNAEGVKNMANHPDGKFELLCDIDMGGAELAPIGSAEQPFTGKLNGANFTISNFTLIGGSADFGFVAVNQGNIQNLILDQVIFQPSADAKNIGTLAGQNQGKLVRCKVTGSLAVTQAAAQANCGSCAGISTGDISYTELYVDLQVTAPVEANVGGIMGAAQGGTTEYVETSGKLEIEGEGKTVGLFAGTAADTVIASSVFLGETNSLNGQLFINFTGNADDDELTVALEAAYRVNDHHDPLPENVQKLRDRVVEEMNAMGTVEWKLHEDLVHTCTCQLSGCNGTYNTSTTYYGIPYNHKGGSLSRMNYLLDEEGYIKSWVYNVDSFDGFDMYMGNDCSTSILHAYWTVSNSCDFSRCQYMLPQMQYYPNVATGLETGGAYPVGGYNCDFTLPSNRYTESYWEYNTEQEMYEAYGAIRKGDAYVYISKLGGHTRMAAADAVVVRSQNGEIDPKYSYVISSEQGSTTRQDLPDGSQVVTTWKVNHKYTFANLRYDGAIPVTIEELITGEMEPATCQLLDGIDGYAGMYNGTVKANYYLDSVDLEIRDASGEVVFFHTMWTTSDKYYDLGHCDGQLRNYKDDFDMANFATPLSQMQFEMDETYSYTVTAHLHTYDDFVVKEGSFVYGQMP